MESLCFANKILNMCGRGLSGALITIGGSFTFLGLFDQTMLHESTEESDSYPWVGRSFLTFISLALQLLKVWNPSSCGGSVIMLRSSTVAWVTPVSRTGCLGMSALDGLESVVLWGVRHHAGSSILAWATPGQKLVVWVCIGQL